MKNNVKRFLRSLGKILFAGWLLQIFFSSLLWASEANYSDKVGKETTGIQSQVITGVVTDAETNRGLPV
jgi:hypothetical protein